MDDVWKLFDTFKQEKQKVNEETTLCQCGCNEFYIDDGNITCTSCQNILGKYMYREKHYNVKRKSKWSNSRNIESRFKHYDMGWIPPYIEKLITK